MDLEIYREIYNKNYKLNSEKKNCLCGSSLNKTIFKYDRYLLKHTIVVCKNCGLIFSNPMLKKSFIENFYQSDFYRKLYNHNCKDTDKNFFSGEGDNSFNSYNFLKKFLPQKNNLNVLEIGSGHNANLTHFKKIGSLFAVDYSKESKKLANNLGIKFEQGGVSKVKNFCLKFDIIILSHVIEHFQDFINDINELKKFTHKNTLFYIEVPSMDLKYNLDQLQNAHNFYFTKNTFLFYLNRLGLICLEHGTASGIHQYGIFKIGKSDEIKIDNEEYKKIMKIHKKFFLDFYWKYLLNLYFRMMIKKLVGRKLTSIIKNLMTKIRNK